MDGELNMSMQIQKTYTCKCGKKRELPNKVTLSKLCGCGRIAYFKDGKVTKIEDRKQS